MVSLFIVELPLCAPLSIDTAMCDGGLHGVRSGQSDEANESSHRDIFFRLR